MDVHNAFLHGDLNGLRKVHNMKLPLGFQATGSDQVCACVSRSMACTKRLSVGLLS